MTQIVPACYTGQGPDGRYGLAKTVLGKQDLVYDSHQVGLVSNWVR